MGLLYVQTVFPICATRSVYLQGFSISFAPQRWLQMRGAWPETPKTPPTGRKQNSGTFLHFNALVEVTVGKRIYSVFLLYKQEERQQQQICRQYLTVLTEPEVKTEQKGAGSNAP